MRRRLFFHTLLGSALLLASASVHADVTVTPLDGDSPAAGDVPTIADAQADFDNARFTLCLQKIARILNSQPAPSPGDRYALLSLKGECLLQQKQALLASEAFSSAAQAATEKPDIALATATSELLKRSSNFMYTPTSGKERKPLSVTDKTKRKPVIAALFADELVRDKLNSDAALASTDIQPVLNFAPQLRRLMTFELAGTDAVAQSTALQGALGAHAHDLISGSISKMSDDADALATQASQTTEVPASYNRPAMRQRRGLTDEDKAKINDMLAASDKIISVAKDIVTTLGLDADFFKADLASNDALQKRLHNMLLGIYRTNNTANTGNQRGNQRGNRNN